MNEDWNWLDGKRLFLFWFHFSSKKRKIIIRIFERENAWANDNIEGMDDAVRFKRDDNKIIRASKRCGTRKETHPITPIVS